MDARYWRVSPKFWNDPKARAWDDDTRMLALYVLTCPHRTTEGLFYLPKMYVSADLNWPVERTATAFDRLVSDDFIDYDDEVGTCLIVKALEYQRPENPNQARAAIKALKDVPTSLRLLHRFEELAQRFSHHLSDALRCGAEPSPDGTDEGSSERLAEPFDERLQESLTQSPPPTQAPTQAQATRRVGKSDLEAFDVAWKTYPRKTSRKAALAAWTTRVRQGVDVDELLTATKNYAAQCKREGREQRFIMHGATFFGPHERWKDHLTTSSDNSHNPHMATTYTSLL